MLSILLEPSFFRVSIRSTWAGETLPLRDAGCREAWIGAESGGQRVADAMNKGTKVE
jgi:anaerobic magnesium-protoporphyrin IX monomethyl ester cyclase